MYYLTLRKQDIILIMSFDADNEYDTRFFDALANKKRVVFLDGDKIKSLILCDGDGGQICYATGLKPRSIAARLEKNYYLNI
ncbi:MAG: hypothetical protein LBQ40_07425 [Clostridiales bacterium]|jgi:hypothetical protein|nr:hypothetical protein [Clostridiales bacterium]